VAEWRTAETAETAERRNSSCNVAGNAEAKVGRVERITPDSSQQPSEMRVSMPVVAVAVSSVSVLCSTVRQLKEEMSAIFENQSSEKLYAKCRICDAYLPISCSSLSCKLEGGR
jgi:hypothetical protein